jgi:hypothetical protein
MSKTAVIGTGVDFAKSGDGFIVAFLTDANDPAQLNIPAGNWNYEIYASMSSNGGTPQMYAELYKYDGTTFTLISTSSNEIIYDGTALNLYTFAMAVPETTLTLTDRLAVKLYATNSGGKTTTIHTQNGHLCQIITTFSTGITALNGLTAQVQYFQTGTSGTDFNISSTTATHTFNIPDASATARGLITTGTQTIAGSKTFSSTALFDTSTLFKKVGSPYITSAGYTSLQFTASGTNTSLYITDGDSVTSNRLIFKNNAGYDYTFPAASGTLALTSDLANYVDLTTAQTIGGTKTFSDATKNNGGIFLQNASSNSLAGYMNLGGLTNGVKFTSGGGISNTFTLPSATGYTFTFPNATGTIALTSDLSDFVTLSTAQTISGTKTFTSFTKNDFGVLLNASGNYTAASGYNGFGGISNGIRVVIGQTAIHDLVFSALANYTYTFPSATGTIALVGGSGVGTVTSVAALTIGTSGTDLSSSVANSTTTPVITLNVPTASATNRGALSSADWTTFNNKQSALTNPVLASGTWTSGYLPKINGTYTIGNSLVQDNGSTVSISTGSTVLSIDRTGGATALLELKTGGTVRGYLGADASMPFVFYNQSPTALMYLNSSGNLGLGVTPTGKLHIALPTYSNEDTDSQQAIFGVASGYGVRIGYNEAGNYGVINSLKPAVAWGNLVFQSGGGNVLIGTTTNAGYKLDVNGTGRFTGALSGTSATFSGILAESKTADGIIQTIGGNLTKANIYQFSTGGLGGAVFNIGHNFYYDGTNYGQGNAAKPGWVISSNINADSFAIARAAAGSTSAPTGVLSFASTGAATFSDSIKTGTPSGGTAKPWKLGQDTSTLYSATRTIQVEIDGGTYYLLAVKSTDL